MMSRVTLQKTYLALPSPRAAHPTQEINMVICDLASSVERREPRARGAREGQETDRFYPAPLRHSPRRERREASFTSLRSVACRGDRREERFFREASRGRELFRVLFRVLFCSLISSLGSFFVP